MGSNDLSYNSDIVKNTLEVLLNIFSEYDLDYRLLGSVVTAAIMGGQHRNLGDLDFLADSTNRGRILDELYKLGYRPRKRLFSFARRYLSMDSLEHDDLLEIGFFWGEFQKDGSFLMGNRSWGGCIAAHAVRKQQYTLHGVSFFGLPEQVIARGIYMSPDNPKRAREIAFMKDHNISPQAKDYIHIYVFSQKADWLYYVAMSLLNIVGKIRVAMGLPYDPWR